jgi:hypothetical protein
MIDPDAALRLAITIAAHHRYLAVSQRGVPITS